MKQLLLIRHGESEADLLKVHEGRADFPLTERGQQQAAAMGKWIAAHYAVDRIFASTLQRAAQSAQYLSQATLAPVVEDEDLMEFNNGLLAGLPFEEAAVRYPRIENLPPDQSVYGQETQYEFRARAERALARCLSQIPDGATAAIVSHGGMINQLFAALIGLPPAAAPRFLTGDTGIHLWILSQEGSRLMFANKQEHLALLDKWQDGKSPLFGPAAHFSNKA